MALIIKLQLNPHGNKKGQKSQKIRKINQPGLQYCKECSYFLSDREAVVVAQLVERSIPTPEIRGSNPVICKVLYAKVSTNCNIEKTKIKK